MKYWHLPVYFMILMPCAHLLAQGVPSSETFHDPTCHLSFDYPAGWNFSRNDGEISTFHLDARSAPKKNVLRAVVSMPENPFPASTFSGAYVYFSVTPHSSPASCRNEATSASGANSKRALKPDVIHINDIGFLHGHDEVKDICITQRDDIYTLYRRGSCLRFDLSSNNFCGGEVSGVKDITPDEIGRVRARLEAILSTIRFDSK